MSLKACNKVEKNRYELEIEISPEIFNKEVDNVYKKEKNRFSIPGFRKGKAPKAFIEKYYGENVFYDKVINNLYYDALLKAAEEANLKLIDDKIDFDLVKASKTDGLIFKVKVTTMPEVTIENYKGIEINKVSTQVNDGDLEEELKLIQKENGRLVAVTDRPAKLSDTVIINFNGTIDGNTFDGGTAENYSLVLGSHQFVDGFEEQIAGHNVGEEFDIKVVFPKNYHAKTTAGKEAVFHVKINSIKETELPVLDDEFVKDISEFDTLDEYKEDLKKKLAKTKQEDAIHERDNQIFDKLVELVRADIPDALIKSHAKKLISDFEYQIKSQGIKLEDYLKYTGNTMEDLEKNFWPQAYKSAQLELAIDKIATLENIEVTDNDIEEKYQHMADHYKMKLENAKKVFDKDSIISDIRFSKAYKIVSDSVIEK